MARLVNCSLCGRDTTNKSGICRTCFAGSREHDRDEDVLRERRDEPRDAYHGDCDRDDL